MFRLNVDMKAWMTHIKTFRLRPSFPPQERILQEIYKPSHQSNLPESNNTCVMSFVNENYKCHPYLWLNFERHLQSKHRRSLFLPFSSAALLQSISFLYLFSLSLCHFFTFTLASSSPLPPARRGVMSQKQIHLENSDFLQIWNCKNSLVHINWSQLIVQFISSHMYIFHARREC